MSIFIYADAVAIYFQFLIEKAGLRLGFWIAATICGTMCLSRESLMSNSAVNCGPHWGDYWFKNMPRTWPSFVSKEKSSNWFFY